MLDNHSEVLILGAGPSGLSALRHLQMHKVRVRVADTRENPPEGKAIRELLPASCIWFGNWETATFQGIDGIVASPGVPTMGAGAHPLLRDAQERGVPVRGDIELFAMALKEARESTGYAPQTIGITGTNGKSTVTDLTRALLQATGMKVQAAGNIGIPVLDAWRDMSPQEYPQCWVLELSSYQLETTHTLALTAGTVLNITPDHLDRYGCLESYISAKARIFRNCQHVLLNRDEPHSMALYPPDLNVSNPELSRKKGSKKDAKPRVSVSSFGAQAPQNSNEYGIQRDPRGLDWLFCGEQRLMPANALRLKGQHNQQNALAALALARAVGCSWAPLLHELQAYAGLPHRSQSIKTINEIEFIDDSKGTNTGATIAALQGLTKTPPHILLIAGGDGKGQDFNTLLPAVQKACRAVLLIGRDAPQIRQALNPCQIPLIDCADLEIAVKTAYQMAHPKDCVLLSPACASFDMFDNYQHRARVFAKAVDQLEASLGNKVLSFKEHSS